MGSHLWRGEWTSCSCLAGIKEPGLKALPGNHTLKAAFCCQALACPSMECCAEAHTPQCGSKGVWLSLRRWSSLSSELQTFLLHLLFVEFVGSGSTLPLAFFRTTDPEIKPSSVAMHTYCWLIQTKESHEFSLLGLGKLFVKTEKGMSPSLIPESPCVVCQAGLKYFHAESLSQSPSQIRPTGRYAHEPVFKFGPR